MGNALQMTTLAHTVYKKCECCNRVKDIYFKLSINDAKTGTFLMGDLDLCKSCGQNLGDILNIDVSTTSVLTEFKLTRS
ncbi:hypothetical protein [Lysinibacillus antri]|uniref:Uncharacterized protein n=1 Tax=Lysinibacillus antri TaxID=2498145 RepID=A0A3S0RHI8_9BACI|nr:hypothetical protein [Lysinibacillus antri]RUL48795.1 hypothetical protein EK386_16285 [Lysinibacillus antri]